MTDPEQNPQPPRPAEPASPMAPVGGVTNYAETLPVALNAPATLASAPLPESAHPAFVPPDLNVPWGWWDVLFFILFYVGSVVVFGIAAIIAGAIFLHIPMEEIQNLQSPSVRVVSLTIIAQAVASIAALGYFWVMVRVRRARVSGHEDGGFWHVMGLRYFRVSGPNAGIILLHILGGVALAYAVSEVSYYIGQPGPVPFDALFKAKQTVLLMMGFGILVAPLVEEMMFRAFLYPVIAQTFGVGVSIIITGTLFGATHAPQLKGAWGQIGLLVGVGIILTWARARSKTVLASFLLHVTYNTTLFAGLLYSTHWLRNL
jgi:membrane protease YdiL (CAAX protease family)